MMESYYSGLHQGRLKGTLLNHEARTESQLPEAIESLQALGVTVELENANSTEELGPATVIPSVRMEGLVHISTSPIDAFEQERVGPNGKFGKGTYFAAGALGGETYDLLNRPGNVVHGVGIEGSVLFVDRDDVSKLAEILRECAGVPKPAFKTSIANADVTGLLEKANVQVDAVVVFMDHKRAAAEVAVLPRATEQIEILERKAI